MTSRIAKSGTSLRQYVAFFQLYLGFQRLRVMWMSIFLIGDIVLQLIGPWFLGSFVDAVQEHQTLSTLIIWALLFLITAIIAKLIAGLASYMSESVGWRAANKLRANLLSHCLRLDRTFHLAHTQGVLIERIDGDVEILGNFFSQFVIRIVGSGLLLIGILVLIACVNILVGALFAAYLILAFSLIAQLQKKITVAYKNTRQATAELSGFMGEQITGREDIIGNGAAKYVFNGFFALQKKFNTASLKSSLYSGIFGSSWQLLETLSIAVVLLAGIVLLTQHAITLGTLFLLFSYTNLLVNNTSNITEQFTTLQQSAASLERINELYSTTSQVVDGPGVIWPTDPISITFSNVSFAYPNTQLGLDHVSFHLQPGEVLGLLGQTGSGKTTITRLLLRFYDPTEGEILFDTTNIRQYKLEDLRRCVGIVTQDVQIFHASVRDNLTLFDRSLGDEKLMASIAQLNLEQWFNTLLHGLDTQLTPTSISSGEAQLLAFMRVFLNDPQIIIFDEASSRLDYATESLILQAMERLLKNRTGIIIAHRLSTIAKVDRIMILENGQVVEDDSRVKLERLETSRFARLLKNAN
jgi:ATP-binding cassette subfamily B protein